MKNIFNRLVFGLFLFAVAIVNGQVPPPPIPKEEAGDIGAPSATPIDMYTVVLAFVAIAFIVYFVKEYSSKRKLA
ncbi:MAG: signal peptidase [Cruoricaptor ignavus]|nr:signal peptidase [Cruoricaptor ignavus]